MTPNNTSFSEAAKKIEKKYKKDSSALANKSKEKELARLAAEQEAFKKAMMQPSDSTKTDSLPPNAVQLPNMNNQMDTMQTEDQSVFEMPDKLMYGGKTKKYVGGGLIAAQAGIGAASGLINIGRGIFGKPREFDPVKFERAQANLVDLGEQRTSAGLTSERNRTSTNATIRNNAGSAGQLLGNSMVNNARSTDDLNRVNAASYMNEENTNAQIQNQVNQFNAQVGNQETMTNFNINQMNANAKDAQQQMIFDGFGQILQSGANGLGDYGRLKQDEKFINTLYPGAANSMNESTTDNNPTPMMMQEWYKNLSEQQKFLLNRAGKKR